MNNIDFTLASWDESFDVIMECVYDFFGKGEIDLDAENQLASIMENLREDLIIGIEYPYVDRVYRNTYYHYFASKHNPYNRDCIRLSLFGSMIRPNHFRKAELKNELQRNFFGYIVLRPTFPNIVGRTMIDPAAYRVNNFQICRFRGQALINGVKLSVDGFPFSSQDIESISCAETTIWSVMEYFGGRYPDYQHVNPSVILEVLNKHSNIRMMPSNGLTVDQISHALKEFGFGTQIYGAKGFEDELNNIISIYVESGIPVIAALENKSIVHAIVIMGHELDRIRSLNGIKRRVLEYQDTPRSYIDYSDIPRKYIVSDDNLTPYQAVTLNNPVEHYTDPSFEHAKIEAAVVPLSRKIYLDVIAARALALSILVDQQMGYTFASDFIFRFFLCSSRSLKDHISPMAGLNLEVKEHLIASRMPKFVWCAEVFSNQSFKKGIVLGLLILDATEADKFWTDSLLFAGYPHQCWVKSGKTFLNLPQSLSNYTKFISNLQ